MTQLKKRAVDIIQRIPEEKMTFIFNILQNVEKFADEPKQKEPVNVGRREYTIKKDQSQLLDFIGMFDDDDVKLVQEIMDDRENFQVTLS
ncbi:MAG: hypothetical protein Ta2F_00690 [Termitinemataceae bacterium]|nr:MAG: hypothetical protein Ta2F_00690 [Termitinemataceae bacterium]